MSDLYSTEPATIEDLVVYTKCPAWGIGRVIGRWDNGDALVHFPAVEPEYKGVFNNGLLRVVVPERAAAVRQQLRQADIKEPRVATSVRRAVVFDSIVEIQRKLDRTAIRLDETPSSAVLDSLREVKECLDDLITQIESRGLKEPRVKIPRQSSYPPELD